MPANSVPILPTIGTRALSKEKYREIANRLYRNNNLNKSEQCMCCT